LSSGLLPVDGNHPLTGARAHPRLGEAKASSALQEVGGVQWLTRLTPTCWRPRFFGVRRASGALDPARVGTQRLPQKSAAGAARPATPARQCQPLAGSRANPSARQVTASHLPPASPSSGQTVAGGIIAELAKSAITAPPPRKRGRWPVSGIICRVRASNLRRLRRPDSLRTGRTAASFWSAPRPRRFPTGDGPASTPAHPERRWPGALQNAGASNDGFSPPSRSGLEWRLAMNLAGAGRLERRGGWSFFPGIAAPTTLPRVRCRNHGKGTRVTL
jgi:hypothetical protein